MKPQQLTREFKEAAAKLQTVKLSNGSTMPIGGTSELRCEWHRQQQEKKGDAIVAAQRRKTELVKPKTEAEQRLNYWQQRFEDAALSRLPPREAMIQRKRLEAMRDVAAEQTLAQLLGSPEVVNTIAALDKACSAMPAGSFKMALEGIAAAIRSDPANIEAYRELAGETLDELTSAIEVESRQQIAETESARLKAEAERALAESKLARHKALLIETNGILCGALDPADTGAGDSSEGSEAQ